MPRPNSASNIGSLTFQLSLGFSAIPLEVRDARIGGKHLAVEANAHVGELAKRLNSRGAKSVVRTDAARRKQRTKASPNSLLYQDPVPSRAG